MINIVTMPMCDECLDGAGGECHEPGCALFINRAPDLSLRTNPMVELTKAPDHAICHSQLLELGAALDKARAEATRLATALRRYAGVPVPP